KPSIDKVSATAHNFAVVVADSSISFLTLV
ncbi:MAG: hypothetical protein ACI8RD_014716, partial [Bacillariaceae sp.]